MRTGDAVRFALEGLRKRKLRTALTASGVAIGVGALVSMISFGKGVQKNVSEAFRASDLFNTVLVSPARARGPEGDPDAPRPQAPEPGRPEAVLDAAAVEAIARIPGVETAYPDVNFPALVGLDGEEEFRLVQVVPAAVARSKAVPVKWGRAYASDDEAGVVVSRSFLRRLGAKDPATAVGRTLRVTSVFLDIGRLVSAGPAAVLSGSASPLGRDAREFPIVGVMEFSEFGGGPGMGQNDVLLPPGPAAGIRRLPFTSVWDLFRLTEGGLGFSGVSVKVRSPRDLGPVKARIREMGFSTFALADQLDQIMRGFLVMDMVLAAVGMIAIVVAALGIVNTMVMSILERTREIGVMKAVGAGDGDIRRIFFFESGAIGLLGGGAGCLLGWVTSLVINRVVNLYTAGQGMPRIDYFAFPAVVFLGAVAFSLLVSLVSGLYPARRAARVDPVVALRHD